MAGENLCGGVKWPAQQLNIQDAGKGFTFGCASTLSGVQSVGQTATFETDPIFQLCQSEIYELEEGLPQIEFPINRVLDGSCPAYLRATEAATSPSLFGRTPCFANVALSIYPCTLDSASGVPNSIMALSGTQVGSIGYTFGVDGAFTEDLTLVGNDMVWKLNANGGVHPGLCTNPSPSFTALVNEINVLGCCPENNAAPPSTQGGVQRRENLVFTITNNNGPDLNGQVCDPDATILPPDVFGINISGVNDDDTCIQSISFSVDLNREDINCLGKRGPQNRSITLPVSVTTDIEVVSDFGHLVSATELGVCSGVGTGACNNDVNLQNRTIRVATCDGLRVYTGVRNKLASVSRAGGDTGGANLTVTYSYQTFNTFVVMHEFDCNPNGSAWWAARLDFLCDV